MSEDKKVIDLAETLISPAAFHAYSDFAKRIVLALAAGGLAVDPKKIPDEQGRVEKDGSLTVFVKLPNGVEVSMSVPKDHWAWVRRQ